MPAIDTAATCNLSQLAVPHCQRDALAIGLNRRLKNAQRMRSRAMARESRCSNTRFAAGISRCQRDSTTSTLVSVRVSPEALMEGVIQRHETPDPAAKAPRGDRTARRWQCRSNDVQKGQEQVPSAGRETLPSQCPSVMLWAEGVSPRVGDRTAAPTFTGGRGSASKTTWNTLISHL